jgi:hypothetical protein
MNPEDGKYIPGQYKETDSFLLVQGARVQSTVEGRYRHYLPLELEPEKQLAEVKAEAARMARELGTPVTVWRFITTARIITPLPVVKFTDEEGE